MTDTVKFREAVRISGLKYDFLAKSLNISRQGLKMKIENDTEFKASEINTLKEILNLSLEERGVIFLHDSRI